MEKFTRKKRKFFHTDKNDSLQRNKSQMSSKFTLAPLGATGNRTITVSEIRENLFLTQNLMFSKTMFDIRGENKDIVKHIRKNS